MRAVIQRVDKSIVKIEQKEDREIGIGLLVLVGIEEADQEDDAVWLAQKILNLRIFNDINKVMNLSIMDIDGELMVISQFTLHARTKKGNRPSYIAAARPEKAIPIYEFFISQLEKSLTKQVQTGEFGAQMEISLINNGPVTIIIDTKNKE
jgi:D-aminoacyl-tRNA deacylase